jgi:hypothetical protein
MLVPTCRRASYLHAREETRTLFWRSHYGIIICNSNSLLFTLLATNLLARMTFYTYNVKTNAVPSGRAIEQVRAFGPFEHGDRGFKSRLRYVCMSAFFCVVLSCICKDLVMGRAPPPPVPGVLPKCLKGFIASEVNFEKKPESPIGEMYNYNF